MLPVQHLMKFITDLIVAIGVGLAIGFIESDIILGLLMFTVMLTLCRFNLF